MSRADPNRIFSIRNFDAYTGRYLRGLRRRTPEQETGWTIEGMAYEKLPILALRNREEGEGPLAWKAPRNIKIAVRTTLDSLKAWKAFRPSPTRKLIRHLEDGAPQILKSFQNEARAIGIVSVHGARRLNWDKYDRLLIAMADAVGRLSAEKKVDQPMLGSKIMHLLIPEFFPVWDTEWIKRALANEKDAIRNLGRWMAPTVKNVLTRREHAPAAIRYARYVALMMKDLEEIDDEEYGSLEEAFIRHSTVDKDIVWWHFYDLAPSLFEVCLLGKHYAKRVRRN